MGKKTSLQTFLQREVSKHRIKLPNPPRNATTAEDGKVWLDPLEVDASSAIYDDDSLFGEPVFTREELLEKRLKELLSEPRTPSLTSSRVPPSAADLDLEALKVELRMLMAHEEGEGERERVLGRRQRAALIEEITRLESEAKGGKARETIGTLNCRRYCRCHCSCCRFF